MTRVALLRFARLTLLSLVASVVIAVGTLASEATEDFGLVLDHGHIDAFTVVWEDDELRLRLQEDVTGHHVLHEPDSVLMKVKESARVTLTNQSFLGEPDDTVYLLPQTQDPDLIWPGWSTERLDASRFSGPVRISIDSVDGPGDVFLWQSGSFGEARSVLESGAYRLPGVIPAAVNAHVHANWAFTEPGRYSVEVAATSSRDGNTVEAEAATYTFDVSDPGSDPDPDPTPTVTPTATSSPSPTATPTPSPPSSPSPSPTATQTPSPGNGWDVENGTVNRSGATVLNNGHIDMASLLEGSELVTKVKDTTESSTPVWRDPAKTVLQLLPKSKATVPSNDDYAFLGPEGSAVYQVTQVQQAELLWPGWSTEPIDTSATTGGVLWALTDMSGPGEFALYETDPFGQPTVLFNTRDKITAADRFTIPKNTHAHGSWAFSEPGNYCLSMQRVAETASPRKTVSDQFVLAVAVGTADVRNVDPAECATRVNTHPPVSEPPPPSSSPGDTDDPDTESAASSSSNSSCTTSAAGTVVSAGHIDYSTRIVDGKLESQIGDDTGGSKVFREPSRTSLVLKSSSKVTLPASYAEVGTPGSQVYQVPQTQNSSLIWLGWSTEALNSGNARGPVTWKLDSVSGPGTVKVYLTGSFGGVDRVVLAGAGSSYTIELGVHAHANWAFSEQGVYRLTMTQSATLADGATSSDTETLTIAVGDVNPRTAATGAGCAGVADTESPVTDAPIAASAAGLDGGANLPPTVATALQKTAGWLVPTLLGVLGVLLLVGAAGTGTLWWRAQGVATGAAPLPAR